jgi:hypothetical protein
VSSEVVASSKEIGTVARDGFALLWRESLFLFCIFRTFFHRVKWVHCHHSMARPRVADRGDGLQIWRVAANIFNKQSRTADSGWSSRLGVGRWANNLPP